MISNQSIGTWIERRASIAPDHIAVIFIDASVSDVTLPPGVAAVVTVGRGDAHGRYEQLVGEGRDEPIDEPVTFDDLFLLPFTSGTTGAPKGIMLTQGNLTWNVVNLLSTVDIRADDV